MKKVNSLILLFLIISVILCGCGKKEEDTLPDTERNPESTLTEETMAEETNSKKTYSSLSNKSYGLGYNKTLKKGEIPSIGSYKDMMEGKNAYYVGNTDEKKIYLTFDEGYENGYTEKILDVLKEKKVPAAFFCTGDYLKCNPELIKRMIDEGHIVGNHSWNHPRMPEVTNDEKFRNELTEFEDCLKENYNTECKYFRYPEGEFSERTLSMINDMGYTTVFWSVAYKDWERDVTKGKDNAVKQVCNQIHNGAIILLHAVSSDNAEALPIIIDTLRSEGYEFVSLEELNNCNI